MLVKLAKQRIFSVTLREKENKSRMKGENLIYSCRTVQCFALSSPRLKI